MRHCAAFLSVIACGACATPAAAQDALGTGNVLDANTGSAYGGLNLPTTAQDYRSRNLIVTRDVVGGRGFRGTVGYTAEYDFRGQLGSDDLFAERANSAFSSPLVVAAGRTLERLRYGTYLGEVEYRRAGRGSSLETLNQQQYIPQPAIDDRINLDRFAISSTSSAIYQNKAEGRVVGLLQDDAGERSVAAASSLFGVQVIPTQAYGQLIGLTSYDMARAVDDLESGRAAPKLGDPFQVTFDDLRVTNATADTRTPTGLVSAERTPSTAESTLQPSYREILERIEERYAAAQPQPAEGEAADLMVPLGEQFDQLREMLAATTAPKAPDGTAPEAEAGAERTTLPPGLDSLAAPLRHGVQIDRLTAADETRFQELLASGEQKLREGEYFWAERRFVRALRFTPGHPLATAGMGHAQIGAGLYAPAALTLRRLLTEHPEMIDVRYGRDVLPSRVRLDIAVDRLRELMPEKRDRALHAFLMAYIGHQVGRPELIEEGLGLMKEAQPDDPLQALLEKVWLTE